MHGAGIHHIINKTDREYLGRLEYITTYIISHREKPRTTRSAQCYGRRGHHYAKGKTNRETADRDGQQRGIRCILPAEITYHP